jgi:hypothetical protein
MAASVEVVEAMPIRSSRCIDDAFTTAMRILDQLRMGILIPLSS